jgi:hypothetical protein
MKGRGPHRGDRPESVVAATLTEPAPAGDGGDATLGARLRSCRNQSRRGINLAEPVRGGAVEAGMGDQSIDNYSSRGLAFANGGVRMHDNANYAFVVKEHGGPGFEPYIACEPRNQQLAIVGDGMIGFELRKGTSLEKAKEIANFMSNNISSVFFDSLSGSVHQ